MANPPTEFLSTSNEPAVKAKSTANGTGVWASSVTEPGVFGYAEKFHGVWGWSHSPNNTGVYGYNDSPEGGSGVTGIAAGNRGVGVWAKSGTGHAVHAESDTDAAVYGDSKQFSGVWGTSHDRNNNGVFGYNDAPTGGFGVSGIATGAGGVGVFGKGQVAGRFQGNVEVTGDLQCTGDIRLTNADGAEEFDIADVEAVEPGTVMVLGDEGVLHTSHQAYDRRVAGIVSGAGTYQPALILDRQEDSANRLPIALFGKVFCKVDAGFGAVQIGDLLTTSPTPGHAMKVGDPAQALGAIVGKALRPLGEGQGLIPVLVALQ